MAFFKNLKAVLIYSIAILALYLHNDILDNIEDDVNFANSNVAPEIPTEPHPRQLTAKKKTAKCNYENANGHFNTSHSQTQYPYAKWQWVSDDCPVVDYMTRLRKPWTSNFGSNGKEVKKTPLVLLFLGDSVDLLAVKQLCSTFPQTKFPKIDTRKSPTPNIAQLKRNTLFHCHYRNKNGGRDVHVAFFKIFGMKHSCENGRGFSLEESRRFNSTAERLTNVFSMEMLGHLRQYIAAYAKADARNARRKTKNVDDLQTTLVGGPIVTMMASCLWDISEGCNDAPHPDPTYIKQYEQGILDNYQVLQNLDLHNIFWRTCPPITKEYSEKSTLKGRGRNRVNQQALNSVLSKVTEREQLGPVIDWWKMMENVPDQNIDMKDGRHYAPGPIKAFLNLYLNVIFDYYPELEI